MKREPGIAPNLFPQSRPRNRFWGLSFLTPAMAALSLTACQTATSPEPIIKTLPPVMVEIVRPCPAVTPALPTYPDPDAAESIFTKVQRLTAGLMLERADSRAVRGLLSACTTQPKDGK